MRKKLFYIACFLCAGSIVPMTVFGKEPTEEELLEIVREAHKGGLWKPNLNANINLSSSKERTEDPFADALQRSRFFWRWIAKDILNIYESDEIVSLRQQYLEQVKGILLQKDKKDRLWTEMFSKNPVLEILKRDVAQ